MENVVWLCTQEEDETCLPNTSNILPQSTLLFNTFVPLILPNSSLVSRWSNKWNTSNAETRFSA
ncbi:hypothetical protein GH733_013735 [Mirounga leonina]|nr:hypothetical protein GH733_013735 [Mirounga leonina]